jgi:hypothetical protein
MKQQTSPAIAGPDQPDGHGQVAAPAPERTIRDRLLAIDIDSGDPIIHRIVFAMLDMLESLPTLKETCPTPSRRPSGLVHRDMFDQVVAKLKQRDEDVNEACASYLMKCRESNATTLLLTRAQARLNQVEPLVQRWQAARDILVIWNSKRGKCTFAEDHTVLQMLCEAIGIGRETGADPPDQKGTIG